MRLFGFPSRAVLLAVSVAFVVAALQGPLRLAWLLHQGAYFEAHKEYTRAIAAYERALELRPQITSHLRIGGIYLAQGRYELAAQKFEEAHGLDPSSDEALLGMGSAVFALGEEGKAIRYWNGALEANPTNAEAHYRLGMAYLDLHLWSAAERQLEEAAEYAPGEERFHFHLGLLLAREDLGEAIAHLEVAEGSPDPLLGQRAKETLSGLRALEGSDDRAYIAMGLGQIYLAQELLPLAQEEFARALSLDPKQHLARSYLGYVLWSLGDYEEASRVLRLQPESALNHFVRGMLDRSQGWLVAALAEFQKALELDPENAAICAEMASAYLEKRDYPAAREWYRAAVERAPGEVQFHLLRAQFHLGHLLWLEEGVDAARMAVALDSENAMAWDLLGWGQYLTNRPKEAKSSLERAIALNPDLASAHYYLGVVYEQERLREEAEWAYGRAIDLDTQGLYRERAQKALKELARK